MVCLTVSPKIVSPPQSIVIATRSTTDLACAAAGYPTVSIQWTERSGNTLTVKSVLRVGNKVTSTISITNDQGADGGGMYICTPSNVDESGPNAQATVRGNSTLSLFLLELFADCNRSTLQ